MVELDRLVKLLVEKMLRSSKEPEPSGSGTDEGKAVGQALRACFGGTAKDATDKKCLKGDSLQTYWSSSS